MTGITAPLIAKIVCPCLHPCLGNAPCLATAHISSFPQHPPHRCNAFGDAANNNRSPREAPPHTTTHQKQLAAPLWQTAADVR